jgi:predicted nucleic acid-binding Zn ribbon protein
MSDDRNHDVASSYCPSQDWDRYCVGQEMPEECPVCGEENSTEDGMPVLPTNPAFCSKKCAEDYMAEQKRLDEAAYQEYLHEKKLIAEHNAKCSSCRHSEKFCFCPTNPDNQEG